MTVLTFPSVCGKSDKAPLIGDEQVHRPGQTQPPPYHPGSLENGDGGVTCGKGGERPKICVHGPVNQRRLWRKIFQLAAALLAFLLLFYFAIDAVCKTYKWNARHSQHRLNTEDNSAVSAEAIVPCKSYTSYDAAENDMLSSQPPSDKNMIISLVLNHQWDDTDNKGPPIIINKTARFVHDFSINITGIIDLVNQRCYVMPLMRSSVEPPESLYDMLVKMSSGYYSSDINKILRDFRIVKPALDDLSDYGMYISKDCADYPTFKLEKDIVTDSP